MLESENQVIPNVLLVEDDDVAAELVLRSLKARNSWIKVFHVWDGAEALAVLRGEHAEITLQKPYIILLDLKMPRMGGLEFLSEIRADKELRRSVVFVLSTSDRESDKTAAYDAHIAGYLLKSTVGDGFAKVNLMLDGYWNAVSFPDV